MKTPKRDDFADRRKTSEEAKKLLLEKFKAGRNSEAASPRAPKPSVKSGS